MATEMNTRPYCMSTGWEPTIHSAPDADAVIHYAKSLEAEIRRITQADWRAPDGVTQKDVNDATSILGRTMRGRHAMQWILGWLDDDGLGLDGLGQEAVLILLQAAWGQWSGSTRDAMRAFVLPHEVDRR